MFSLCVADFLHLNKIPVVWLEAVSWKRKNIKNIRFILCTVTWKENNLKWDENSWASTAWCHPKITVINVLRKVSILHVVWNTRFISTTWWLLKPMRLNLYHSDCFFLSKKVRKGQRFGTTRPPSFTLFPFFSAQTEAEINDHE